MTVLPEAMDLLEEQVRRWMPASHGMWAMWALVQGRENVERENLRLDGKKQNGVDTEDEHEEDVMEFDYLKYASGRIRIFRDVCREMGVFE
jgi:choline kinase